MEILALLNPWWKGQPIASELAKPYKRAVFSKILGFFKYRQILVLSGLRRVGKTTLLYQTIEDLLQRVNPKNILYFSFDKKTENVIEVLQKYGQLTSVDWKKEKIFLFLDEISKLDDWGNKIKLLYDSFPNIKFFVSSSGSIGLEESAVKSLGGRYFLINVPPLSFTEYLELKKKANLLENLALWENEIKAELEHYLLRSFPETIEWEDELVIKDYLRTTIIDKIVKTDLPEKFRDINKDLLLRLLNLFYSQPGIYFDYDSISKQLGVSKKTLSSHLYYLEFSYLIRRVRNFRISSLASSRKLQRIYPYWWTLAYCYTDNKDKILETMVGSLIDASHYWRDKGREIDFLKVSGNKIFPIEVKNKAVLTSSDVNTMKFFLEKYKLKEGLLIYQGGGAKEKGNGTIICTPLWKWLLGK